MLQKQLILLIFYSVYFYVFETFELLHIYLI